MSILSAGWNGAALNGSAWNAGYYKLTTSSAITETVFDSFSFSDSLGFLFPLGKTFSDNFALRFTDYFLGFMSNLTEVLTDDFTFSDGTLLLYSYLESVSDTGTLSDGEILRVGFPLNAGGDQIVFNDGTAYSRTGATTFNDSVSLSDSVQLLFVPTAPSLSDDFTFTDAAIVNLASIFTPLNFIFNDEISLTDGISASGETFQFSESFAFGDSFSYVLQTYLNPYLRRYLNDVVGPSNP